MKRLILLFAFSVVWPFAAFAQQFAVGDQVMIGSTGETGKVLQVGQPTPEGGVMIKVLLDRPGGPSQADREVWYNSKPSLVSKAGTPAAPAAPNKPNNEAKVAVPLQVGDRVNIGSLGVNGTVVQVLGVLGNGAQMLRIEIDKNAPKYPGVSNMYDTISSKITLIPQ